MSFRGYIPQQVLLARAHETNNIWNGKQMSSRIICLGSISKLSIQTQQYSFVSDLEVFNPEKLFYCDKFPTVYIS
jgi:hypothetical protein